MKLLLDGGGPNGVGGGFNGARGRYWWSPTILEVSKVTSFFQNKKIQNSIWQISKNKNPIEWIVIPRERDREREREREFENSMLIISFKKNMREVRNE